MGKNFGTTISPWVVTMDALEQFTVPNMELRNPILDYLKHDDEYNFDIKLQGIDCITFHKYDAHPKSAKSLSANFGCALLYQIVCNSTQLLSRAKIWKNINMSPIPISR